MARGGEDHGFLWGALAEARASTEQVGGALQPGVGRSRRDLKRVHQHIGDIGKRVDDRFEAISKSIEALAVSNAGQSSADAGGPPLGAPPSAANDDTGFRRRDVGGQGAEHVVLFQFAQKHLHGDTVGLEQSARRSMRYPRSEFGSRSVVPQLLDHEVDEAASCTRALEGNAYGTQGRVVQVIRKGAKAALPPDVQRCGKGLVPAHDAARLSVSVAEKLHRSQSVDARTRHVAINEGAGTAPELSSVQWTDDGSRASISDWECLNARLTADSRKACMALLS